MIIFLDIDGVLVHANPHRKVELEEDGFYKFNDIAVEIVKSAIYTTKDQIVLSTSHIFRYSMEEWSQIFKRRGLNFKFLSILDNKNSMNQHRISRKKEIVEWIEIHNIPSEDVVIIDDDKSLNELPSALKNRLVLTNPYMGLSDIEDLKTVLKRRMKKNIVKGVRNGAFSSFSIK